MGASEGKAIGEWFGPNTVAQVLRKLAVYDHWTGLVIHIAMDNCLIIDDIYKLCIAETWTSESTGHCESVDGHLPSSCDTTYTNSCCAVDSEYTSDNSQCSRRNFHTDWRPLLLVIPMRLGLSDVNPIYFDAVKTFFTLRQSVGVIGGRPNNAFWFIGCTERKLFYLDPHKVQPFVDFSSIVDNVDDSFHCAYPSYMDVSQLDPSIAVGFYCSSREEFDDLCQRLNRVTVGGTRPAPLIEVHSERPAHFPPAQPYTPTVAAAAAMTDFTMLDEQRIMDSEDEFEILM